MSRSARLAKILIVDDHPMVREGMVWRLSATEDLQVCGQADSEESAMDAAAACLPDLMIIDLSLKSGHGIDLIKRVKSRYSRVKMLVVSGFQESLYAERALRAGADGYLNKQDSGEKLLEAIRTVLNGDRYVSPEVSRRLIAQAIGQRNSTLQPMESLTNRELEIHRLIGQGKTSGAMARQLGVSTHTIDSHRENIKRKLGLRNSAELSRHAVQYLMENC